MTTSDTYPDKREISKHLRKSMRNSALTSAGLFLLALSLFFILDGRENEYALPAVIVIFAGGLGCIFILLLSSLSMFLTLNDSIRNASIYRLTAFYFLPGLVCTTILMTLDALFLTGFVLLASFMIPYTIYYFKFCKAFVAETPEQTERENL